MPLVEITMIEGRSPERIRALIHEVHEAVRRSLEAPPESIRVVIREVPPTHWAAGDVTIAERRATAGSGQAEANDQAGAPGRAGADGPADDHPGRRSTL